MAFYFSGDTPLLAYKSTVKIAVRLQTTDHLIAKASADGKQDKPAIFFVEIGGSKHLVDMWGSGR